jgi:hypothetical protein
MAKVNFRQAKRQKEMARKERQSERLLRRGERPVEGTPAALAPPESNASPESKPAGGGT